MSDRSARFRAAREAVLQARLEAERPWWQRRFFAWLTALPSVLWRGVKAFGEWLAELVVEVSITLAVMAIFGVIVLLLS